MHLVFDAFELTPHSTKSKGIYSYAVNLCRAMAEQLGPGEHLHVAAHGDNVADFAPLATQPGVRVHTLAPHMPSKWQRLWWSQWGATRWCRTHSLEQVVYLSPKGFTPGVGRRWHGVPTVCVVHDLIPLWYLAHEPAFFGRLEGLLVKAGLLHTARHADRLVAISEATAQALAAVGADANRVSVVYNGVPPLPQPAEADVHAVASQGPFCLAMASGLPHKNLAGVLAAYAAYRDLAGAQAWPLKVVGVTADQVVAHDPAVTGTDGVEPLGTVSASMLAALYQQAEAFLFLSWIEGFGFPPLEALRAGTPVVCSDIAAHRELCAGLATLVSPADTQAAAAALWSLQADEAQASASSLPTQRLARVAAMEARLVGRLNWAACAQGVWAAVRALSAHGGAPS